LKTTYNSQAHQLFRSRLRGEATWRMSKKLKQSVALSPRRHPQLTSIYTYQKVDLAIVVQSNTTLDTKLHYTNVPGMCCSGQLAATNSKFSACLDTGWRVLAFSPLLPSLQSMIHDKVTAGPPESLSPVLMYYWQCTAVLVLSLGLSPTSCSRERWTMVVPSLYFWSWFQALM